VSRLVEAHYRSPYGPVELHVRGGRLVRVLLGRPWRRRPRQTGAGEPPRAAAPFIAALERYFRGEEAALAPGMLDLSGVGEFDRLLYSALEAVRFGSVVTYGELAARAGHAGAARAVGNALRRNPVPLFVPCHRVIRVGGEVGGFGAGTGWKVFLLAHEGWTVREGRIVDRKAHERRYRTCVYAGSFDPPTLGHMYMIERGAELFDRLIVAVGVNPNKRYTFSVQERLRMLRRCVRELKNVEVDSFEGRFLVHYAHSRGAGYILRGIRTEEDYRFEHAMRNVNEDLRPGITTVFLIPPRELCEISSSFVKGLVGFEGWQDVVKPCVPAPVFESLTKADIRWSEARGGAEGGAD